MVAWWYTFTCVPILACLDKTIGNIKGKPLINFLKKGVQLKDSEVEKVVGSVSELTHVS